MSNLLSKKIIKNKHNLVLHFNARKHKNVINKFANKSGLVYFGYVNQHSDDHKIIRGLTVSTKHVDDNYCIGSIGDYNVSLVDRSDIVSHPNGSIKLFSWIIMSFDLLTEKPIPHFFIQSNNKKDQAYDALFSTFPNMKPIIFGTFESYSSDFASRFSVFTRPTKSVEIEHMIDAKTAMTLAAHFWPFSAEQHDNVLYIYSNSERITIEMLDTMLESGLWLAGHIDNQTEQLEIQTD